MAAKPEPFQTEWGKVRPDYPRSDLEGRLVGVMRLKLEDRGLQLIPQGSRCIRRHDVHELILTTEPAKPGMAVGRAAYQGFVEFAVGGVALLGDEVLVGDAPIGSLLGFDETHLPNHLNIVVWGDRFLSGVESGFRLGDRVQFRACYTGRPAT